MEKLYNKFSDSYNKLFEINIKEFVSNYKNEKLPDDYFPTFYPMFGIKKDEPCDFLIVGQATNGWRSGFCANEKINTKSIIKDAIEFSNSFYPKENHCPIDWVNVHWTNETFEEETEDNLAKEYYSGAYRTCRSFFWKVTYKLVSDYYNLNRESWDWSKKIVWSNLYKIAPDNANPNLFLRSLQQPISCELIKKEIEELKPKFCIILTNESWWVPFKEIIKTKKLILNSNLTEIVLHEQYLDTQIIVTTRPRFGNGEIHVKQILEMIKP